MEFDFLAPVDTEILDFISGLSSQQLGSKIVLHTEKQFPDVNKIKIALIGVLIYIQTNFPDLGILDDKLLVALVLLFVFGIGVLITWISTYFATQRFLNLRTDDLY